MKNEVVKERKREITECLQKMGVSRKCAGFFYLRSTIDFVMENFEKNLCSSWEKMQEVYPVIAEKFHTTARNAKKTMQCCVDSVMNKGNTDYISEVFTGCFFERTGKPTDFEFVKAVSDYIFIEEDCKSWQERNQIIGIC